jgi:hypothetical protein
MSSRSSIWLCWVAEWIARSVGILHMCIMWGPNQFQYPPSCSVQMCLENGGSIFLWNTGQHLWEYMVLICGKPQCEPSPPSKPQVCINDVTCNECYKFWISVLGSCAHVTELHRFQQDPFTEQDMLDSSDWTMQNILTAIQKAKEIHGKILKCYKKNVK